MDIKCCIGCREDFYNGNNPYGVTECWMLKKTTLISRRRVGINDVPPWTNTPEELPHCYAQDGFIFVTPDRER